MPGTPTDVLVAGYRAIDSASADFASLIAMVKDGRVEIEPILVVDLDYEPRAPHALAGTVKQVVFDLKSVPRHDDVQALHAAAHDHNVAHGVAP